MAVVSMKNLLEAGVHFGHQTRRWNPKMKPYIFTERNGIYILDLQRTLRELDQAYRFARRIASDGGAVLFVGTKKQAQEPIMREATRCGMPYINERWLGGMLTNWVTVRTRINRMVTLEQQEANGTFAALPKKEASRLRTELEKLQRNLDGIRDMTELPQAVFVIDTKKEAIGVAEARRLRIPLIGLVDTNADPDEVDYVIPGNDDAIRAVNLMVRVIADGIVEGRAKFDRERNPAQPSVVDDDPKPQPFVVDASAEAPAAEAVVVETPAADALASDVTEPGADTEAPSATEEAAAEASAE